MNESFNQIYASIELSDHVMIEDEIHKVETCKRMKINENRGNTLKYVQ